MAVRSFGFMLLRRASRQGALRSRSSSIGVVDVMALPVAAVSADASSCGVAWQIEASRWLISSRSTSLNDPMRLNISSHSTWWPSNSGPSTQTNFVFPPTVMRQAPHMPVPSTMMVFSDTSVGMLYFWVSRQQNFIMMAGPMAKHLSTFSRLMTLSMPSVTRPLLPYEPSSVMMMTSSDDFRTSFSRIIRSLVRPARTEITRLPASFRAWMMGSIGATPTPPPAHTTVPKFSMCVACPSGPTTSRI